MGDTKGLVKAYRPMRLQAISKLLAYAYIDEMKVNVNSVGNEGYKAIMLYSKVSWKVNFSEYLPPLPFNSYLPST